MRRSTENHIRHIVKLFETKFEDDLKKCTICGQLMWKNKECVDTGCAFFERIHDTVKEAREAYQASPFNGT